MKTLEQQLKDPDKVPMEILSTTLQFLNIEGRGGGSEGIYYTHPEIDGEFLFRNLDKLIFAAIKLL